MTFLIFFKQFHWFEGRKDIYEQKTKENIVRFELGIKFQKIKKIVLYNQLKYNGKYKKSLAYFTT